MRRGPATPTLVANPVLIGAAAVLVTVVALFLSYNANTGLPFVPTYNLTAYVRDANQLGHGAEVRVGGKRVGLVTMIAAEPTSSGVPVAKLQLKLDKTVEPLPVDTRVRVRPKSIIGLKYLEVTPGRSHRDIPDGGTIPLRQSLSNVDLQDALNAFDKGTRQSFRAVTSELGTGLGGRGGDLSAAIQAFDPLLRHLIPVFRNVASPATDLDGFLRGIDAASSAVAPVSVQLIGLFDGAATTLHAIARERPSFAALLDQTPTTERVTVDALSRARPVLERATRLVVDLRPGVALLPGATTKLARTLAVGTPVLRRADGLADRLGNTLATLHTLVRDPATSGSVIELTRVLSSLVPTLTYLNPVQVRCNYLGLYFRNASSVVSEGDANGNWFRFLALQNTPDNPYQGKPAANLHFAPYSSTGQDGHCTAGNERYAAGQQIGSPPNAATAPDHTEATHPPAGGGG